MPSKLLLSSLLLASVSACVGAHEEDSSLYLTGTEESAITTPSGAKVCAGKKVLICHIPPGNPANAHTICVGKSAVDAHQKNHQDLIGACAVEPTPPPSEPPPADDPPSGDPPSGDQPEEPTIL